MTGAPPRTPERLSSPATRSATKQSRATGLLRTGLPRWPAMTRSISSRFLDQDARKRTPPALVLFPHQMEIDAATVQFGEVTFNRPKCSIEFHPNGH